MVYTQIYVLVCLLLAYFYYHQLQIVQLISTKANLKLRNKIVEKQEKLRLFIKLCPVWPILLIKELYDEVRQRTQSKNT